MDCTTEPPVKTDNPLLAFKENPMETAPKDRDILIKFKTNDLKLKWRVCWWDKSKNNWQYDYGTDGCDYWSCYIDEEKTLSWVELPALGIEPTISKTDAVENNTNTKKQEYCECIVPLGTCWIACDHCKKKTKHLWPRHTHNDELNTCIRCGTEKPTPEESSKVETKEEAGLDDNFLFKTTSSYYAAPQNIRFTTAEESLKYLAGIGSIGASGAAIFSKPTPDEKSSKADHIPDATEKVDEQNALIERIEKLENNFKALQAGVFDGLKASKEVFLQVEKEFNEKPKPCDCIDKVITAFKEVCHLPISDSDVSRPVNLYQIKTILKGLKELSDE
jgi:hypothetical protein